MEVLMRVCFALVLCMLLGSCGGGGNRERNVDTSEIAGIWDLTRSFGPDYLEFTADGYVTYWIFFQNLACYDQYGPLSFQPTDTSTEYILSEGRVFYAQLLSGPVLDGQPEPEPDLVTDFLFDTLFLPRVFGVEPSEFELCPET